MLTAKVHSFRKEQTILKVRANGNSLIATIPNQIVEAMGIKPGDRLRASLEVYRIDGSAVEPH